MAAWFESPPCWSASPALRKLPLGQVAPAAIDADTRTVLEATAAGNLPRIWG
jgi:hypothetical protein